MCGFKSGLWTAAQLHYSLLSPKRDASSIPLESLSTPFIVCPPHSTRRVFDMRSCIDLPWYYPTNHFLFCSSRATTGFCGPLFLEEKQMTIEAMNGQLEDGSLVLTCECWLNLSNGGIWGQ